jgi:hypothetical protein
MSAQQRRPTYAPERFDPRRGERFDPPERYLASERRGEERLDVREILKREALNPLPPPAHAGRPQPLGISDQYVMLDTFLKLRESATDRGEFRWNFMVQGVTGDEVIGVRDEIDNVIEIQIGSFAMPNLPEVPYVVDGGGYIANNKMVGQILLDANNISDVYAPTLGYNQYATEFLVPGNGEAALAPLGNFNTLIPWIHNPYSQVPFFGGFTVQVREAGLQSYSDRNGARHHFDLRLTAPIDGGSNPNMLLAAPQTGKDWDTYTFTDPLKDIHGISLVFRNPDIPIRFLPDCLYNTAVDIWINGSLDPPPPPYLRFYYPGHKLRMGDRIFVQGFKSGNVELDTYVNRPEGLVASGDPTDPYKINPGVLITKREVVVNEEDPTIIEVKYVEDGYFWTDPAINLFNVKFPGIVPEVPEVPGSPPVPAIPAHPGMVSFIATQTVTVCVANRRMRIPMRIRRIVDRVTNHITP